MSRAIRLSLLFFLSSVSIAAAKGPAASPGWAYVFVDPRPLYGFEANLGMSYNSNGGTIKNILAGGTHTLFLGLITEDTAGGFLGGVAHVSAYGEGYCNIANWHPVDASDVRGPGTELTVNCFQDSGAPAVAGYVLTFSNDRNPGAGTLAWLFADRIGPANPDWSYSSTGLGNRIAHLGSGVYTVDLGGLADLTRGTAQVTAYGSDNGYCNLGNWGLRAPYTEVEVRCFDFQGVLQDHLFTFSYAANTSLLGAAPSRVAHVFASDGFSTVPRLGEPAHQFNSGGFTNPLGRIGSPRGRPTFVGSYGFEVSVVLALDEGGLNGIPIAVAFGSNAHCRPVGFTLRPDGPGRVYTAGTWVFCTMPGGLETDSAFVAQVVGR